MYSGLVSWLESLTAYARSVSRRLVFTTGCVKYAAYQDSSPAAQDDAYGGKASPVTLTL
mgnify:CR=1 FL=1